ncbi:uncharacterized protein LOC132941892 [Metopolophium dirhodum]|uniref:uncharacterized protein LOC132941892 n=1 Tax=Metopolophium dirhodum TaxID=44670 RepID=UPI00298F847E|nr:uncharacterized protein LOC132941892 [Metopolophium dirhodum]
MDVPIGINPVKIFIFFVEYLLNLTDIKGVPIYLTPRKTFIIGLAIAIKAMFSLADEIFQITQYKYILTYKFSQDHLEMFFSKIRQRFGNNNNPNALELKTAMKQILLKNSITSSYAANCIALDNTGTESVFEIRWAKKKVESLEEEEEIQDLFPSMNNTFDIVKDNILYYISGFIVRCLLKKVDCQTCANSMLETLSEHNYNHKYSHSILVNVKNRGGLIKSSINV